jgi:DNA-binding CsgD family transcriptional regulator
MWDELAAFDAAENDAAMRHLLTTVAELVGAQNAYWMGAVQMGTGERDPLCGWRPRCIEYLRPLPNDQTYSQQRIRSLQKGRTIDEATVAQARRAGTFRACRLRDLVSEEWFQSETYQWYLGRSVHDSLTVGVPVSAAAESYYGFLRLQPDNPFTEAECALAYHALRGLTWFHRRLLLGRGLVIAQSPLSPTERRVLAHLLTDKTEKAIAAELELTPSTLHTYVKAILRKFAVSGRSGLVALWLGQQSSE